MALDLEWQSTASDGTLPNDKPADEFQYRAYLDFELPMSFLFGLNISQVTAEWSIRVKLGSETLFHQKVKVFINVIHFGVVSLDFFVWSFNREEIETPIVDSTNTGPGNESWKYTIGGTVLSEFGTMEMGGGTDYTNDVAYIQDWWDSPVYEMHLPVGCKLEVEYMRLTSGGITPNSLAFQFRFEDAEISTSDLDRHGAIRVPLVRSDKLNFVHTYRGPKQRIYRYQLEDVYNPAAIWKDVTGRCYLVALTSDGYCVWYSDTEWMDAQPLVYDLRNLPAPLSTDEVGKQVSLWKGNWRNVQVKPARTGGAYSSARLGNGLYFMRVANILLPGNIKKIADYS